MMTIDFIKYNALRGFNFGQMNQFIKFEKSICQPDGLGGYEEKWIEVGCAWAKVAPMLQLKNTDLYKSKASAYLVMRYDHTVEAGMRLVTDKQAYDICHMVAIDHKFLLLSINEVHYHV